MRVDAHSFHGSLQPGGPACMNRKENASFSQAGFRPNCSSSAGGSAEIDVGQCIPPLHDPHFRERKKDREKYSRLLLEALSAQPHLSECLHHVRQILSTDVRGERPENEAVQTSYPWSA